MNHIPENLRYTSEHEWASLQADLITIGITDFAQSSLGDIVFIELPAVGTQITKGKSFGVVESIKSVSDLYAPIDGTVEEVNSELVDSPEKCNQAPYSSWMIKVRVNNKNDFDTLLNAQSYHEVCQKLS